MFDAKARFNESVRLPSQIDKRTVCKLSSTAEVLHTSIAGTQLQLSSVDFRVFTRSYEGHAVQDLSMTRVSSL